jgi:hypothetical protein
MFSNLSSIYDEEISRDDPLFWSRPSPFNCNTIRIIGIFLCLSSFVGIILNGSLFSSFIRYKDLRSPPNIFVMFLTGIGFVGSLSTLPLTGVSSIYCYWLFNRVGCQFEAVMAFLYGTSSSYLLCAVSLSRCYIIIRPFNAKDITVEFLSKEMKVMNLRLFLGNEMCYICYNISCNCISMDNVSINGLE